MIQLSGEKCDSICQTHEKKKQTCMSFDPEIAFLGTMLKK